MSKKAAERTTTHTRGKNDQLSMSSVAYDLLDVTWRISVPVIACAGGGIIADNRWSTAPLFTLLGVAIGFFFAVVLVKQELAIAERADAESTDKEADT